MTECAKTHLQQSRISKFSGEDPRTPLFMGRGEGRGREGKRGRGKGREGGRGRTGKGGEGQGREGRNGGGKGCSTWAPPPRDKLWIRPC